MITNGQFFSSFVFTLCLITGLVAFAGVVFLANRVWRLSQPLREHIKQSRFAQACRQMVASMRTAKIWVKSSITSLLTTIVVRPWQAFVHLLAELGDILHKVPWGSCVGAVVVCSLPFQVFTTVGMPLRSIIGVSAAGALIGAFCAPFTGWRYRTLGPQKAIGVSLLTVVGGAYSSSMLVAFLIAMASD